MPDVTASKAYAATQLLELIRPDAVEHRAVRQYLERLGYTDGAVQSEPTDDPSTELIGLDECLECIGKVHPSPGKASSIRTAIKNRLRAISLKSTEPTEPTEATEFTPTDA